MSTSVIKEGSKRKRDQSAGSEPSDLRGPVKVPGKVPVQGSSCRSLGNSS